MSEFRFFVLPRQYHVRAPIAASTEFGGDAGSSASRAATAPEQRDEVQVVEARNRDGYTTVFLHPVAPSPACPQSIQVANGTQLQLKGEAAEAQHPSSFLVHAASHGMFLFRISCSSLAHI